MRYYGLQDALHTLGKRFHVDEETTRLRLVDLDVLIACLRASGGPDEHGDSRLDTADAVYRLVIHCAGLHPYVGANDVATSALAQDLAGARGFNLILPAGGLPLIQAYLRGDVDADDLHRHVVSALQPRGSARRPLDNLRNTTLVLGHPITRPRPDLAELTQQLVAEAQKTMRQTRARVLVPSPRQHIALDGRRDRVRSHGTPPAGSGEIMRTAGRRLFNGNGFVIVNDSASQGVCIERDWAHRVMMPVFELLLDHDVEPYQDGTGRVQTILVDPDRPLLALCELERLLSEQRWRVQDHAALAAAYQIKNDYTLLQLRSAWASLDNERRKNVLRTTGMSWAYAELLMTNGLALEVASEHQRRLLEMVLGVSRMLHAASYSLDAQELRLLAGEARRQQLSYEETLELAAEMETQFAVTRRRDVTATRFLEVARAAVRRMRIR